MQTIYYSTSNFIRHTGNMVDLDEFRRKSSQAQQDALARQPEQELPWCAPSKAQVIQLRPCQPPQVQPRPRRSHPRRCTLSLVLDACASLGVVAMTLTFALQVMP